VGLSYPLSNAYLFDLNDNRLELVKEYKYLGLTVTCSGKLNYAAEILAQKARRKAFFGLKANIMTMIHCF
jgi:hypothetical protein